MVGQSQEQGQGHAEAVVYGQEDPGGRTGWAPGGSHQQKKGEHQG